MDDIILSLRVAFGIYTIFILSPFIIYYVRRLYAKFRPVKRGFDKKKERRETTT